MCNRSVFFVAETTIAVAGGNGLSSFQAGADDLAFQKVVDANIRSNLGGVLAVKILYNGAFAVFDAKIKGFAITFDEGGNPVGAELSLL